MNVLPDTEVRNHIEHGIHFVNEIFYNLEIISLKYIELLKETNKEFSKGDEGETNSIYEKLITNRFEYTVLH